MTGLASRALTARAAYWHALGDPARAAATPSPASYSAWQAAIAAADEPEPATPGPASRPAWGAATDAAHWQQPSAGDTRTGCHAGRDGECTWAGCPQLRDDEPRTTGRHCPLDTGEDDDW